MKALKNIYIISIRISMYLLGCFLCFIFLLILLFFMRDKRKIMGYDILYSALLSIFSWVGILGIIVFLIIAGISHLIIKYGDIVIWKKK